MGLIIVKITKLKKNFFNRNTLHINGSTALDFLQALSDKNLISKIREQSKLDKEYFEESVGGALLEDYLGGLAIKIDLGIEVSEMNRDIAFGMLYRRDYPVKCRKEKKKVTTTAIIIKPSTVMNIKPKVVITTKMNNITPISKKTKATAAITTHKPRSSTTFAPIDQCKLFNNAKLIERYACNCADLSIRELNADFFMMR
uniref:Uncharacterized protein n=1 Tax=Meloidogyne incognita TaxID=6306 RepID=A0A914KX89_MELIC